MHLQRALASVTLVAWACSACVELGDDGGGDDAHATEIISRVELRFTPVGGGEAIVAAFSDPDGDGGVSGEAEAITLAADTEYSLRIGLLNDLADPPVDIGAEVEAEAEEHMVFLADAGALLGLDYADLESDYGEDAVGEDLPLGMVHAVTTSAAGATTLRVVLRHLPALNGAPQKTAALPQLFSEGGALPGDVDVDVSFALTVE